MSRANEPIDIDSVYIVKILNSYSMNNEVIKDALVRANYQNLQKGIKKDMIFLERFFRNLLMGENNELRSRYLHVRASELLDGAPPQVPPQVHMQA